MTGKATRWQEDTNTGCYDGRSVSASYLHPSDFMGGIVTIGNLSQKLGDGWIFYIFFYTRGQMPGDHSQAVRRLASRAVQSGVIGAHFSFDSCLRKGPRLLGYGHWSLRCVKMSTNQTAETILTKEGISFCSTTGGGNGTVSYIKSKQTLISVMLLAKKEDKTTI